MGDTQDDRWRSAKPSCTLPSDTWDYLPSSFLAIHPPQGVPANENSTIDVCRPHLPGSITTGNKTVLGSRSRRPQNNLYRFVQCSMVHKASPGVLGSCNSNADPAWLFAVSLLPLGNSGGDLPWLAVHGIRSTEQICSLSVGSRKTSASSHIRMVPTSDAVLPTKKDCNGGYSYVRRSSLSRRSI